ncbi:MAG TPA: tRNA (adenosine(37)-N6)-threonylcarbamoyltransferase complex transferase subunit TsaD [Anaerolineae bacterium]|nr:tRNA (adenosine(37)-N6)-threonylcarbamoyltransferase complex transferase subunit TsaD [Anaerolineae bacterium]
MTHILAIETSCDETAAAVIADGRAILSNVVASQIDLHRRYGGVFPEVASRQHVLSINPVVEQALGDAELGWADLDAVAVTEGPGLAGSLLVGVNAAKGIAFMRGLPLVAVNHLEGHVYSNWLAPEVRSQRSEVRSQRSEDQTASLNIQHSSFPILVLIVSGGHTELVLMEEHGRYRRLGGTLDDAAGEAFDKAARLLGLPYPGGPMVQRAAQGGDPARFPLPRALMTQPEHRYNFSFSGLKTAALRLVREQQAVLGDAAWPEGYAPEVDKETSRQGKRETREMGERRERRGGGNEGEGQRKVQVIRDVAASFQAAVADALVSKTLLAAADCDARHVCVCGGVAANGELRRQLAERMTLPYSIPPIWLCTDNAAMIGAAAHYRFVAGLRAGWDLDVKARLPLQSW